ncbi:hypothetical protein [Flavobacterium sp. WC2429]|uniref:DUF4401 domain-containing protein n=2 Tax=unclassified Flavobacterium TaxID=196869 RepID=A0AB39W6F2_9FLAO
MMIQYDKTELENVSLVEEAHSLKNAGFISKEQYNLIVKELIILKSNTNILVRIGFFILGSFLYSSICGFISLILLQALTENYKVLLFIYTIIGFVGTEILTKQKYYGHGLDDAFLIGSQLTLAIAIGISTNGNGLVIASILTITSLLSYLRYLHLSMAFLFCISGTSTLVYTLFEFGAMGKTILPFVIMLFSAGIYLYSKKVLENLKTFYYYKGIQLAYSFSLILFYLSGNYLVVRELSVALLGAGIAPNSDIPFAFLFYAFTFIVPIGYVVYSLLIKDRIMLWIGLVALCFSFYTIRFYYAILPIEIVLTIGGLVLFAFTYFSIKKLKNNTTGITFQPDRFSTKNAFMNAEALITSQLGLKPEINQESNIEFGGGGFSGGGSSGNF